MTEEIIKKLQELASLGKEKSEIELWERLLPNMNDDEQKELLSSLAEELALAKSK